jgi:LCP family protein required for cell wall assembly
MSAVLPGAAQLLAGRRSLGHLALRIWMVLWLVPLAAAVVAVTRPSGILAILTNPAVLHVTQVLLIVIAIGWVALIVDAWRLAHPPELAQRHRVLFTALTLGLVLSLLAGLTATVTALSAQRDLVATVFAGGGTTTVTGGRINILLLGGDSGKGRTGLRPDSLTLASINAETDRTVLIGLPRNLQNAPFPEGSPLRRKFPKGFRCGENACMLNAVYTYASENRHLYQGVRNPGAQATAEAVEGVTGLAVNYFVLIDLRGFQQLVDAVDGITLDVGRRVPIGGGTSPITGWIETGRDVHLNGYRALWSARSRADSSDYDRMARQKCVLNAMLTQLDPMTVARNFTTIASAGKRTVGTNIPPTMIPKLAGLASRARSRPIANVGLVPPQVQPADPSFPAIRRLIAKRIAASDAADASQSSAPAPTTQQGDAHLPSPTSTGSSTPSRERTPRPGKVCRTT